MDVRRVVTGQTATGKSVFASDERVTPITLRHLPGTEFHTLWGSDATVRLPTDGVALAPRGYFPPVGGFRFALFTAAPSGGQLATAVDPDAALAELGEKLPGLSEVIEPDRPGMHRSDTVDFVLVLSGEIWLELDDGAQVRLQQGDCVVQNGTRHAWRNKSAEPCVLATALIGAEQTEVVRAGDTE